MSAGDGARLRDLHNAALILRNKVATVRTSSGLAAPRGDVSTLFCEPLMPSEWLCGYMTT